MGNIQKRLRRHKERHEVRGEGARAEKAERSLTARLQHYSTTGHPRGSSNFESMRTRFVPLPFTLALHFAVVITSCSETSSPFSRSCSTKNPLAEVGGRMMLSVIVSCADTQGPPRDIPHVRRSRTDSEERRRATPNSQPTGRIDIVPREWAFGTTLAISRLGNCFAVSQRTTREVNDTRRLSKHTAEYHFVTPRIRVTESSRAVSPFLR